MHNQLTFIFLFLLLTVGLQARRPSNHLASADSPPDSPCELSLSRIDQDINNVRARLRGGGDLWWDLEGNSYSGYIVPKPAEGQLEVSAISFAGLWIGGVDPGGNLKLACASYSPWNEFYPGPLSVVTGTTTFMECKVWDRHFRVLGDDIRESIRLFEEGNLTLETLPEALKKWPAKGNPYFLESIGFPLPHTPQGLAPFYDHDDDGLYNPMMGDFPTTIIRPCDYRQIPDEIIFWIFNDEGSGAPHGNSNGQAMQVEVQAMSIGYITDDELNDATFQQYKIINRGDEDVDSTFIGLFVDFDLGCQNDDYIGFDTASSFMYVYNQDDTDGDIGKTCTGGVPTYGNNVPALGIDWGRTPINEHGELVGVSSFTYISDPLVLTQSKLYYPNSPIEYYNRLNGRWNDNSPMTVGGDGAGATGTETNYAFPSLPSDPTGWSMCTANMGYGDKRALMSAGPFLQRPGSIQEIAFATLFSPYVNYPCPDLTHLFKANKLANSTMFECGDNWNFFAAPSVKTIELNREIVLVLEDYDHLENDWFESDAFAPDSLDWKDKSYKFQGYEVYQLISPNVPKSELDNPDKARMVAQVDVKDTITALYNWKPIHNPLHPNQIVYEMQEYHKGANNNGIKHTFSLKEDAFSTQNTKGLINHKKYYYTVVAYAYNNYETFQPHGNPAYGQEKQYLRSKYLVRNYTAIPRPEVNESLHAQYGEGAEITRLEGIGAGGNFLDLTEQSRRAVLQPDFDGMLTYQNAKGPFTITIFNPFEVQDGDYELFVKDNTPDDLTLDSTARWQLVNKTNNETIASDYTLERLNEQIISQFGFTITLAQTNHPGDLQDQANGSIGMEIEYADPNQPWLTGVPDQDIAPLQYLRTRLGEPDAALDPNRSLGHLGEGFMVPFALCNYKSTYPIGQDTAGSYLPYITPSWLTSQSSFVFSGLSRKELLKKLPNIDIVLTQDTSLWSRCVVVETANRYYTGGADLLSQFGPYYYNDLMVPQGVVTQQGQNHLWRKMFDTRYAPSVGKNGLPDGSTGNETFGKGWFPGYAIDVETGRRLNLFFGENSCYSTALDPNYTGRDMIFNPTSQFLTTETEPNILPINLPFHNYLLGGQHFIYVTNETYDSCNWMLPRLSPEIAINPGIKNQAIRNITWCGMIMPKQGFSMKSAEQGLIPNDARIKIRVQSPYQVVNNPENDQTAEDTRGYPHYRFSIHKKERKSLTANQISHALDSIKIVPNPYYGFSQYESLAASQVVKVTNLPTKCTVTIYTIDGKYVQQLRLNDTYAPYDQVAPALEWDLKNYNAILVGSGVYLFQVDAPGIGSRTLKWFGINRKMTR